MLYTTQMLITRTGGNQLGTLPLMSIVKIKESDVPQEFYVVLHNAYNTTRTLLLRRYIHSNRQWHSSNVNAYASCTLNAWFNGDYLNSISVSVRGIIDNVEIPYTPGNGNNTPSVLSRKVFALSGTELGQSNVRLNAEGVPLTVVNDIKIATNSTGVARQYWTRSPRTGYTEYVWDIATNGSLTISGGQCTNNFGVRPAFTLPASTIVDNDGNIIA